MEGLEFACEVERAAFLDGGRYITFTRTGVLCAYDLKYWADEDEDVYGPSKVIFKRADMTSISGLTCTVLDLVVFGFKYYTITESRSANGSHWENHRLRLSWPR